MSHSTVLVIVREAGDPTEAEAEAERLLEPFNENTPVDRYKDYEQGSPSDFWLLRTLEKEGKPLAEPITWQAIAEAYNERYAADGQPLIVDERGAYQWSTYNPRSKWDWYELGGRWQGFFPTKRPLAGRRGRPGTLGSSSGHPTWADLAQVKDIDWEHLRHVKRIEAEERYRAFEELVETLPEDHRGYVPWRVVLEKYVTADDNSQIDAARAEYHAQHIVKAMRASTVESLHWADGPDDYFYNDGGRERYIRDAEDSAGSTFAVLDGEEWHERGSMGWFGMVADEKDPEEWNAKFRSLVTTLPDDAWLAVYDVHI
jgi:hypothetical protein